MFKFPKIVKRFVAGPFPSENGFSSDVNLEMDCREDMVTGAPSGVLVMHQRSL